jgi:DNA-binding NtrC family response regulator
MASVLVPAAICGQDVGEGHWREAIRAIFSSAHPAPVLLAASLYDWRLWVESIDRGAFDLLIKPFDGVEPKLRAAARHWRAGRIRRTWDQGFVK